MLKVTQYALHPQCCYLCRQPRLPAIDTLMDEETPVSSTRIYLCAPCLEQAFVKVSGDLDKLVVRRSKFRETEARNEALEKENAENRALAEMWRGTLAGIAAATEDKFGITIDEAIVQIEGAAAGESGR